MTDFTGPDRRIYAPCSAHSMHEKAILDVESSVTKIWPILRTKLSGSIALIIFCTFTVSYLTGLFVFYKEIQTNRLITIEAVNNLQLIISDIKADIKVINLKLKIKKEDFNGN